MAYQGSALRNTYRGNSYSYSMSPNDRSGYGLVMPKSYGTDIHLQSYLGKMKTGIAGYAGNLLKYSVRNLASEFYPLQKTEDLYKKMEKMKNYELKTPLGGSGVLTSYDLPSMRRAVMNLEKRLNLN